MKKIIVTLILVISIGIAIFYKDNKQELVKMENEEPDTLVFMLQQEDGTYEKVNELPTGYALNEEKSVCTNGVVPTWSVGQNRLYFTNLTNGSTSCYLYFDKTFASIILANNPTISTRTDFNNVLTSDTTGTIYQASDADGTTYYFAGDTSNNWVQFAGFYWRIIRINGDGSVRLIYNGTSNAETGTLTQLSSTSAFNSTYNDNMYVGFKYTSGNVHGTGTKSTILEALDTWYNSNLTSYEDQIELDAGFCNDRYPSTIESSSNGSGGTGTIQTYYAAYIRLHTNKTPTYECQDSNDLFTDSKATIGNKALDNPIGLITADEVMYAGGVFNTTNQNYYLYTNQYYWSISPSIAKTTTYLLAISSYGYLVGNYAGNSIGVRPVINLKASATISSGNGTVSNPYVVE